MKPVSWERAGVDSLMFYGRCALWRRKWPERALKRDLWQLNRPSNFGITLILKSTILAHDAPQRQRDVKVRVGSLNALDVA